MFQLLLLSLPISSRPVSPFSAVAPFRNQIVGPPRRRQDNVPSLLLYAKKNTSKSVGSGRNWIERSFPLDVSEEVAVDPKQVIDYDLGINGESLQTGPLSGRMFQAILERSSLDTSDPEIRRALKMCALDFTAKEAVRAALKQNGLELALTPEDEEAEGLWGDVDSIRIGDSATAEIFDDWEDCVDEWTPGETFHFVVRQVPAKMAELSLDQLLAALDPDGSLKKEAEGAGMVLPVADDIVSLAQMSQENRRRVEDAPRGTDEIFEGTDSAGYRVIPASNLLSFPNEERTVMHVMDALVSHGVLIVDLEDDERVMVMARMWETAHDFFETKATQKDVPPLQDASETGSSHAKVGYANYDNGAMQFLETRRQTLPDGTGVLLPCDVVSDEAALLESFDIVASISKAVTQIAVAAATQEAGVLQGQEAVESATKVAEELLDDGRPLLGEGDNKETTVSMSPHRLCRYANNDNEGNNESVGSKEIFGAHTGKLTGH